MDAYTDYSVKMRVPKGSIVCDGCGASVLPDPMTGHAVCEYCGKVYTPTSAVADAGLIETIERLIQLLKGYYQVKGELDGNYRQLEAVRREKATKNASFTKSLFSSFSGKPVDNLVQTEYMLMQSIQNNESELAYFKGALETNHIDMIPAAYQRVDVLSRIVHILKSGLASTLPEAYRRYEEDNIRIEQERMAQRRHEEQMALQRQQLELERKRMEMKEWEEFERFTQNEDKKDKKAMKGLATGALAAGGMALATSGGRKLLKNLFDNLV